MNDKALMSSLLEDDETVQVYRGYRIGAADSGAFTSPDEVDEYLEAIEKINLDDYVKGV